MVSKQHIKNKIPIVPGFFLREFIALAGRSESGSASHSVMSDSLWPHGL